jgi:hypothetical protein
MKFWHDHVLEKIAVRDDEQWYMTYTRGCENDPDAAASFFKLPSGGGEASVEERQWLYVYVCLRAGQFDDAEEVLRGVRECRENTPHQTELLQRLHGYRDSDFSKSSGKYPGSAKDFMQRPYKTLVYQVCVCVCACVRACPCVCVCVCVCVFVFVRASQHSMLGSSPVCAHTR